jgi:hypothetical protein
MRKLGAPAHSIQAHAGEPGDRRRQKRWTNPAFWSAVGLTELKIYEALADRNLATILPAILPDLSRMKDRVIAPRMWDSVYDQWEFIFSPHIKAAGLADQEAARKLLAQLKEYTAKKERTER